MAFLIQFFLKNNLHSKRTIWMIVLSFIPVGFAALLWLLRPVLNREGVTLFGLYPQMSLLFYLHFLLPLMSVFMGTAVIADEVDERTLPYLLVRPVSRRDVVLSKIISNTLTLGILLFVSLFLSYSLMAVEGGIGSWVKNMSVFLQSGGVLCLGALVYTPLFACLGGLIKRPVLVGLFFMIGWENTIGSFPGNIKLITIVHYLHVLFPPLQKYNFINLVLPTKQVSDITAILILLFLAALFTGLSMSLLYVREYRLEQS